MAAANMFTADYLVPEAVLHVSHVHEEAVVWPYSRTSIIDQGLGS